VRSFAGLPPGADLWFGILPISAGVFGVAIGALVAVVVSVLTRGSD
jgi:cation/acetate symporter